MSVQSRLKSIVKNNSPSALIMLVGVPGSGKSSVRRLLCQLGMPIYVASTDDYIEQKASELSISMDEAFRRFYKEADVAVMDLVKVANATENCILIWDQTNVSAKSRAKKLGMCRNFKRKIAIVCEAPDEVCIKRAIGRRRRPIPAQVVQNMLGNFDSIKPGEGFDCVFKYDTANNTLALTA